MKKILLLVILSLFVASPAFADIATSPHDLSVAGGVYTGGTMSSCQYCHTPHHAEAATAPLWNKTLTATTFTLYGGGSTLAGTTVNQPGANSLTCLTCHDGTLNVGDVVTGTSDVLVNAGVLVAITGVMDPATGGYIGTDLSDSHPVGMVYNSGQTLAGLNPTVVASGSDGLIAGSWKIYGGLDNAGTVECGSCHDPHNTTAGETPFLKGTSNTICSDCHSAK